MTDSLFNDLPRDALLALNRICNQFEQNWSAESVHQVREIVADFPPEHGTVLLIELIALDAELRVSKGKPLLPEMYLKHFPDVEPALLAQLMTNATHRVSEEQSTAALDVTNCSRLSSVRKRLLAAEICTDSEITQMIESLPVDKDAPTHVVRALRDASRITSFQADVLTGEDSGPWSLGEYVLLERLGSGGMGRAYRAFHRRMHRIVVVKLLNRELQDDQRFRRLFEHEFIATGQLTHPNIVTAFDAGESDGQLFLVTEYVNGRDLARVLKEDGPLDPATAISVVRQAATALAHVHERGVVHRDIKPGNLLSTAGGTVKLLDLGLSKLAPELISAAGGEAVSDRFVMGTAAYMPPEQSMDTRAVDHRSDIYSLGCTLFTLLTGKPCYPAETVVASVLAHRNQPIPSLCESQPNVSPDLDSVFRRMVAKQPADRFDSMNDVLAALEPVETRQSSTKRFALPLAAVAVACVVALFGFSRLFGSGGGLDVPPIENEKSSNADMAADVADIAPLPRPGFAVAPFSATTARELQDYWAKKLNVDVEYRDRATRLTFVLIPPGEFTIGSDADEVASVLADMPLANESERAFVESESPQRRVQIERPYFLSATEVTTGRFRRFVDASGYVTVAEENAEIGYGYRDRRWVQSGGHYDWQNLGDVSAKATYPVVNITRADAEEFCRHFSRPADGVLYRLPTESEWEYACRAGTETRFHFGDSDARLDEFVTVSRRSGMRSGLASVVGSHAPNAFGLFDMHGNVAEWCSDSFDWHDEERASRLFDLYPHLRNRDEVGVVRGGSVQSASAFLRSASRQAVMRETHCASFRVVLEIRPVEGLKFP